MGYYNQHDYPNIPYPSESYPNATVSTSGCGAVCASMLVEELTGEKFPPAESAVFSMECGARAANGTDMRVLAKALSEKTGIAYTQENDVSKLTDALKEGASAIVNVGGDREGYKGLFSSGGHYVFAKSISADGKIIVQDPAMYAGKFSKAARKGRAEASGNDVFVDASVLAKDAENRYPRYYIFYARKEKTVEEIIYLNLEDVPSYWKDDVEALVACGALKGDGENLIKMTRDTMRAVIIAKRYADIRMKEAEK